MNAHQSDISEVLNATANQILAIVAPATARLVRAHVSLNEQAETAGTDGVHIQLPPTFVGVDVAQNTPVAVGLLVHELGHFLQPLAALEEVEQRTGAPHWLGNIITDIQLEAMMACLFPPLADTLTATRAAVKQANMTEYRNQFRARPTVFTELAVYIALLGRFGDPTAPFALSSQSGSQMLLSMIGFIPVALTRDRATAFAWRLAAAADVAAADLPDFVAETMQLFPELRQATQSIEAPVGGMLQVKGAAGRATQAEALANTSQHSPVQITPLTAVRGNPKPAVPGAQQAARTLAIHFQTVRGATEIAAPGRFDRRAAALDELIPFRLALPGKEQPRPQVVICLDKSGSMRGAKMELAQTAAQAVALAVKAAGGEVVGILFDDAGEIADTGDDALLFFDRNAMSYGGTDFGFLADAWRRWPAHFVLVVTDGDGSIPPALPGDKARTAVILIPPDGDLCQMQQIADRVVTLNDLSSLAAVMTLLLPTR